MILEQRSADTVRSMNYSRVDLILVAHKVNDVIEHVNRHLLPCRGVTTFC